MARYVQLPVAKQVSAEQDSPVQATPTEMRGAPLQARSGQTVDLILEAAAQLLEEKGFEKLSTNMICKQAGLTPPALYRYFPNKYAVLKELGERLMARQNELVAAAGELLESNADIEDSILSVLEATVDVTRRTVAGIWIMRSLHAIPLLSQVRVESHRSVARMLTDLTVNANPNIDPIRAYQRSRLAVELGYAAIEMVFDETVLDEQMILRSTASLLARNMQDVTGLG